MRRLALRIAAGLLALLALAIAFVVVQWQRHPSLAPYRTLTLPAAPADAPVRVRFAGVSTLVFDDGETVWMTDGFFSRPPLLQTALRRLSPDAGRIDEGLQQLGVTRLAAVVPVHSHYDHAMDSPAVARRTGALLIGGESTLNVGRGQGLPPQQMRAVHAGDTVQLGRFRLHFIASRHSPTPYSSGEGHELIEAPLVPPAHASAWREGDVWSLVVTHASGRSFLVQGSAGYVPGALAGVRADTVFLGVGTLGKKDDAYRTAYWDETVKAVGARRVIPVHWDDFTHPLSEPLQTTPLLLDDFDIVMADLSRRGAQAGVEIRLPPLFTPFAP
ncbi:MAG: MBL fold metallo-hydrolase [Rhizobacter sp.]|nr:MBL fold metallo-hydrolase [Rhizobacter sp.]